MANLNPVATRPLRAIHDSTGWYTTDLGGASSPTRQPLSEQQILGDRTTPPSPATITRIREHLTTIMASGTTTERKAAIETLIAEVRITDQGVVPVFKIATDTTMPPPNPDGGTQMNNHRFAQWCVGGPPGTRTQNLRIKSPQLCH